MHIVGTAAMAPREMGGVVDGSLKVYGTTNLRVIDASIIPIEMACHTQSTVYAIAEKVSIFPTCILLFMLSKPSGRRYYQGTKCVRSERCEENI